MIVIDLFDLLALGILGIVVFIFVIMLFLGWMVDKLEERETRINHKFDFFEEDKDEIS